MTRPRSTAGCGPGLAEAVNETRRARGRVGLAGPCQAGTPAAGGELPLGRAGRLLAESFLPGPVAAELRAVLAAAERAHQPVRLGLAVPPELAGLPWEALPSPDGRGPLALHPLVSVYRKTERGGGAACCRGRCGSWWRSPPPTPAAGRCWIMSGNCATCWPRSAPPARTPPTCGWCRSPPSAAIRAELDRGPAHVLHVSGHGSPGTLALENDDGSARPVTADEFADQAVPPGQMPPVITLSACYTDAAGSQGGVSFAARLCQRGAAAVIATETSITDRYATRLLARVYGALAQASDPDVVAALADARRQVQAELETSPDRRDAELAGLGEWAAVTVLAAAGSVPVLDPGRTAGAGAGSRPGRGIAGLAGREDWYFVGRRREQRRWPADLTESAAGGDRDLRDRRDRQDHAGRRDHRPGPGPGARPGPGQPGRAADPGKPARRGDHHHPPRAAGPSGQDTARRSGPSMSPGGPTWAGRTGWRILRGHVLDHVPVLLLLDNFEDNLRPGGDAGYAVGDEVLAGLLAAWVADPGRSRLLVTCRYRFTLPGGAERALSFRQLGALSRAETMKLAWSLPALDRLDEGQLEQVWRLAGGHPRSLEYLDALLSGGTARYPDVTARLAAAVTRRLSGADRGQWLAARTGLDAALAETVALAADDVLLDDLLARLAEVPGAADLLLGVSVYREPVDRNAVLFQAGQPDPDAEHIPDREAAYRADHRHPGRRRDHRG